MNSVGSQFARAGKVWLRDTASLSFTHRALLRLVNTASFTHRETDRWWWGLAFRIPFVVEARTDKWGGGGVHSEYSSSLTDRGLNEGATHTHTHTHTQSHTHSLTYEHTRARAHTDTHICLHTVTRARVCSLYTPNLRC